MNPVSKLIKVESAVVSANGGKKMQAIMVDAALKLGIKERRRGTVETNRLREPALREVLTKLHSMRYMPRTLHQK